MDPEVMSWDLSCSQTAAGTSLRELAGPRWLVHRHVVLMKRFSVTRPPHATPSKVPHESTFITERKALFLVYFEIYIYIYIYLSFFFPERERQCVYVEISKEKKWKIPVFINLRISKKIGINLYKSYVYFKYMIPNGSKVAEIVSRTQSFENSRLKVYKSKSRSPYPAKAPTMLRKSNRAEIEIYFQSIEDTI